MISFLDLSQVRKPLWGYAFQEPPYGESPIAFEDLLQYVKKRLAIPLDETCPLHNRLFATLTVHDSVTTLNYDIIADRALWVVEREANNGTLDHRSRIAKLPALVGEMSVAGETPPSLTPWEQEWGFYLKLHGSLDWVYCPTPGCQNNVNISQRWTTVGIQDGPAEGVPCRVCGSSLRIFLVPPIATKRLEERGRLALQWRLALDGIAAAARLVLIGVSLAASDFELRWLIRQAMEVRSQNNLQVHIVNPNAQHRKSVHDVFPGLDLALNEANTLEYMKIEDYLAGRPIR